MVNFGCNFLFASDLFLMRGGGVGGGKFYINGALVSSVLVPSA